MNGCPPCLSPGPHGCGTALRGRRTRRPAWTLLGLLLASLASVALPARAAVQFDVFVGYDETIREGGWFPITCEVFNDGPAFDAVVEIASGQLAGGQARRVPVELPTNTRKRFTLPIFSAAGGFVTFDARLLDARGKVRGERLGIRPKSAAWEAFLLGGVARNLGGLPSFPPSAGGRAELAPRVCRLLPDVFPDNPIALEGLNALYLNSERAPELKKGQYDALVAWVHAGGHLIVAVEQAAEVTSLPWLAAMFPVELGPVTTNRSQGALQAWLAAGVPADAEDAAYLYRPPNLRGLLRGAQPAQPGRPNRPVPSAESYANLAPDSAFEQTEFALFTAKLLDGRAVLQIGGLPLAVSAPRGRGQITALLFSPEREPFRSWKNRGWFWARLLGLPAELFGAFNFNSYGGTSTDGVIGAMIDSRQVRKLPVEWLLLLLLVYLVVIGPFDQWWLKKINRQMLTWVTFPAYVALFSLLIYFIGYKLRAGETEWNELSLVDVLPRGEKAELRGRTYISLYSSVNARYPIASDQTYATVRPEFRGFWQAGSDSGRTDITVKGNGFDAQIAVPVWTSMLYVNDWEQTATAPVAMKVRPSPTQVEVALENRLARPLPTLVLVWQERLFDLGSLKANEQKTLTLPLGQGRNLNEFIFTTGQFFSQAAASRGQAFGRSEQARLDLTSTNAIAASFVSLMQRNAPMPQRQFVFPAGFDLGALAARGDAILLAWDPGRAPVNPVYRFNPPRVNRHTLYRLAVNPSAARP